MSPEKRIKILIAKPGLDGHDRGAKVLARSLMEAGFDVIYTGIRQTPEKIVKTAIQEDVDVVGLSVLSGAHMYHFKEVIRLLKKYGAADKLVIGGGIIPEADKKKLEKIGVAAVFGPGTDIKEIVEFIKNRIKRN
ncbi:MAG: cobalamin B12-binding domain-containing protein [Nitrososphaeria archaeon]|jgi:methylmalonyl-CoA mutase C-terminal domain/subunit